MCMGGIVEKKCELSREGGHCGSDSRNLLTSKPAYFVSLRKVEVCVWGGWGGGREGRGSKNQVMTCSDFLFPTSPLLRA